MPLWFAIMSSTVLNDDLIKAQYKALSRQVPLLYFILVATVVMLAFTFYGRAPDWMTTGIAAVLCAYVAVRFVVWWRHRHRTVTPSLALREFRRTKILAAAWIIALTAWGLALLPHGTALEQSHAAFFMMVSIIGSMFCLIHLRPAALIVAAIGGGMFVGFFANTGIASFRAMSASMFLVLSVAVIIVLIQSRDFSRLVSARTNMKIKDKEQNRLLRMIDEMPVAVMTVEPETLKINYANQASRDVIGRIEHLLPIKADDLLGTSIDVFHRHPQHQRRILSDPANLPYNARINLGPEVLDLKISAVNGDDGVYLGPMLTWAIVTKEVEAESRIRQLAHFDTLTGLANRNTLHEELRSRLAVPDSPFSLLYIDLDGFKLINDTKGHRIGDALLRMVADRLRSACRESGAFISRLGGDEFAVVAPIFDDEDPAPFASALIRALSAPYFLGASRRLEVGASIGIAIAPVQGSDAETLLSRADIALYAAKAAGKGTYKLFVPSMEARIQERIHLEAHLRSALAQRRGLFVFYQPIVDIETGRVTAREALIRWYHPQRGWISPAEFIPVAEQSGLIGALGRFVLFRACREAAAWDDGARVAVNISALQLGKDTLVSEILSALTETGLAPDRLEIEVTETALLGEEAAVLGDLRQLRRIGVRVALDDFGTGFSSLAHLRLFPFDKIKIDGSFVRDAVDRPDCAAVVKAIADLGSRLGVTTVAEGVESSAHLERIRAEGCLEVQGYLFGGPSPSEQDAAEIEELTRPKAAGEAMVA